MNVFFVSLRSLLILTVVLGGIYPLLITFVGKSFFPIRSQGSILRSENKVIGSELIAQKFVSEKYFWPRPSSIDYGAQSSGASQKSGTSKDLKEAYLKRKSELGDGAPNDMLYASGSGLDPHISLESARFQKKRISVARNISEEVLDKIIDQASEERFLGFMGQPRVNVLKLNQLLDK